MMKLIKRFKRLIIKIIQNCLQQKINKSLRTISKNLHFNQTMQRKQAKKQILSQQLQAQIQKLKRSTQMNNPNEDIIAPFQILEKKLKRLQQKLTQIQNTQYYFHQEKKSSEKKYFQYQQPLKNIASSSTKQKQKRSKSSCIESGQITNKNSKLATPQKKKKVIVSHINFNNQSKEKSQFHQSKDSNQSTLNKNFPHKNNSDQKLNKNSSRYHINKTNTKENQNFAIDDHFLTDNKLAPRHFSSNKKCQTQSLKKQRASSSQKNIKSKYEIKSKRYPSMLTEQFISQDDPKKFILKLSKRNNLSYNVLDHHILSYSRQPLIPLKQKINLEKQLKQYSKQNLKLKGQISHLRKYQQEYWKMKEIFQKFEKQKYKTRQSNNFNIKNN